MAPGANDDDDSIKNFLLKALDPPHPLSILNGIKLLQAIRCLDENENITILGETIAKLPLDPRMGRLLLLGSLMGCGQSALAACATMGYKEPFILPVSEAQRTQINSVKRRFAGDFPSDQMTLVNTYKNYVASTNQKQFCDNLFISRNVLIMTHEIAQQMSNILKDVGMDLRSNRNMTRNEANQALISALIGMSLYPDVGYRRADVKSFITEKGKKAKIHPSSVLSKMACYNKPCTAQLEFVGFGNLILPNGAEKGSNMSMLSTSPLCTFGMFLSCGSMKVKALPAIETAEGVVVVSDEVSVLIDDWLNVNMKKSELGIIIACREVLFSAIHDYAMNPNQPLPADVILSLNAIIDVLAHEQGSLSSSGRGGGGGGEGTPRK